MRYKKHKSINSQPMPKIYTRTHARTEIYTQLNEFKTNIFIYLKQEGGKNFQCKNKRTTTFTTKAEKQQQKFKTKE